MAWSALRIPTGELDQYKREMWPEDLSPIRPSVPIGRIPVLFSESGEPLEACNTFIYEHLILRGCSPESCRTYGEALVDYFTALEESTVSWQDADRADLAAYREQMRQRSSGGTRGSLKPATINLRLRVIIQFYKWAIRNRTYRIPNLSLAELKNTEYAGLQSRANNKPDDSQPTRLTLSQFEQLPAPLTAAKVQALLRHIPRPYKLIALLQVTTGMRSSEALGLAVNQFVEIPDSQTQWLPFPIVGKHQKPREILMPASVYNQIRQYINTYRRNSINKTGLSGNSNEEAVFLTTRATPITPRWYAARIRKARRRAGIPCTPHTFRATYACAMLNYFQVLAANGKKVNPLLVVKKLLGHESIQTTERYLRVVEMSETPLDELLEDYFGSDLTIPSVPTELQ